MAFVGVLAKGAYELWRLDMQSTFLDNLALASKHIKPYTLAEKSEVILPDYGFFTEKEITTLKNSFYTAFDKNRTAEEHRISFNEFKYTVNNSNLDPEYKKFFITLYPPEKLWWNIYEKITKNTQSLNAIDNRLKSAFAPIEDIKKSFRKSFSGGKKLRRTKKSYKSQIKKRKTKKICSRRRRHHSKKR